MYCVKCGKAVNELNGDLCSECAGQPVYVQPMYAQPVKPPYGDPANKKVGFGNALTSTITGVIGFVLSYIAFMVSILTFGGGAASVFLTFIGVGLSIVALVLGIGSIKVFSGFKNARPKPVATLVLGIVGMVSSAIALWISLMYILLGSVMF